MSQSPENAVEAAERRRELRLSIALVAMILLTVVGVVVNIESTEVYMNLRIAPDDFVSSCNISERVNCEEVEKSEWAALFGVPTALWAVVGYLLIGGLAVGGLLFRGRRRERGFLFLLSVFSLGVGLWLIYLMAFEIGSWCTLCLASDAANLGLLVMVLLACRVDGRSPLQAVADDLRWVLKSPLVLAGHLGFGGLMVGAAFGATALWIDPPLEAAALAQAQEVVDALTLEGIDRDALILEKQRNPGVDPNGQPWAGAAIPSEACEREDLCSCDGGADLKPKKITVMGEDEQGHQWIGAPEPVLVIQEFTDYECPHCRTAHMRLRRLLSIYPGQIRLIHRHFPLDSACNPMLDGKEFHLRACELSRVAFCAGEQGRFWEMNDLLFQRQAEIKTDTNSAEDLARRLELDVDRFQCCMTSEDTTAHLAMDLKEGIAYDIVGTPAFVVDGEMYLGKVPTTVLKVLREE
ncbi:MAG: vitamin K epoxide reductase family protein [Pseudomonadota bacterium]